MCYSKFMIDCILCWHSLTSLLFLGFELFCIGLKGEVATTLMGNLMRQLHRGRCQLWSSDQNVKQINIDDVKKQISFLFSRDWMISFTFHPVSRDSKTPWNRISWIVEVFCFHFYHKFYCSIKQIKLTRPTVNNIMWSSVKYYKVSTSTQMYKRFTLDIWAPSCLLDIDTP